jgi:hypothetical protein
LAVTTGAVAGLSADGIGPLAQPANKLANTPVGTTAVHNRIDVSSSSVLVDVLHNDTTTQRYNRACLRQVCTSFR